MLSKVPLPTATGPGASACPAPRRRQGHWPVAGAVTRGHTVTGGQEGAASGLVGSGRDLRVVRIQGLLLAEAADWSSLRLGFCPPTPVLMAPRQSSGLGPLPGAGLCQALASGLLSGQVELPRAGILGQAAGLLGAGPWPLEAWPVPGLESSAVLTAAHSPPRVRGPVSTGRLAPSA